ncbi:MAG: hypothetical protein E6J96_03700 [Methanobacteriota archaeon]|nr:MAG: hypothetical protein E6J96_03700 [Euryarchaeota archaeon]
MAEQKDDINEERRILKKAGILDDKLLDRMDIYPGDRVRFRFYYPQDGRTTVIYKDRNYLEEFENLEPNLEVREQIRDLDARHGRHIGHEFG